MKKLFYCLIFLISSISYGQKEASNWYFGFGAGIAFNQATGIPSSVNNGQLFTNEGCTTISDSSGNLLFYTDGTTVWNKNHGIMFNGTGLFGDPSSTQSAIIVPKPNTPNIYYIFTADDHNPFEPHLGLNYSEVDMTLNGGLGAITNKNINLLNDSSEKLTAVIKDCITKSIWMVTFASENGTIPEYNTFHAFEVSDAGVNLSSVKSTFPISIIDYRGNLKLSPDGTKMASANFSADFDNTTSQSHLFLYDFDSNTGIVSNQKELRISGRNNNPYGVEFSPSSQLLYVYSSNNHSDFMTSENPINHSSSLIQFDVTQTDIQSTEIIIDERQLYRGGLQLGPDGKIYRALSATYNIGLPFLGVINDPNNVGNACNYQHNAIKLSPNQSTQGLPPFISSFFTEKINITRNQSNSTYVPLCIGEPYTLIAEDIPGATYTWTLDGLPLSENDFDLDVTKPGLYKLVVQKTSGGCDDLLEGEALVAYFNTPIANAINDVLVCDGDQGKSTFNFSKQTADILKTQDISTYNVKHFTSQEDADLNKNEITGLFNNTENPQRIYTRVGLTGNTTCFDTSVSFLIHVFDVPIANTVDAIEICDMQTPTDLDYTNGQTDIDLHQFDNDILGSQDPLKYSITYHNSIPDAEAKNGALNFLYYNKTAFKEIIYARIENKLNTKCFAVSLPIDITINPLPEFTNTTLIQCDEDGIDDKRTSFNLFEAVDVLTNNVSQRSVKFYNNLSDAENSLDEILNIDSFENTNDPQLIFTQIIDDNTSCFNIAELTLEVSSNKINNYAVPPVCDELNSEDGINIFNLDDITTGIQSINGITFPITYYETYNDALIENNDLGNSFTNTNSPYTQTIYARAENSNACFGIAEVYLKINKLPNIIPEETIYYCLNKFPEEITIDAGFLNGNTSDYTYNWSNGDTTFDTQINTIDKYTVTVTNKANGCSKNRIVTVEPSSIATFNTPEAFKIIDVSQNNTITVFASGEGTYQYRLIDDNNIVVFPYQDSNIFENVFPGIYTVSVKDVKNECGTISSRVSVIGFPKFFTPNNDGVHDTWQIIGTSSMFQPNSKILIFNRFGKLIKELDPLEKWDGLFNGSALPTDDYWFSIKLQDGRIFKNHFTLKY